VNDVTVYPLGVSGNVAPLASGPELSGPFGLALDASGNIYATNQNDNTITVYAPGTNGSVAPITIIGGSGSGLLDPNGIAIDASGNIYVANNGGAVGGADSVTVYPPLGTAAETPVATITGSGTGLSYATGIAVDPLGNIYVANGQGGPDSSGSVTVYPAGSNGYVTPLATISDNPSCAPCDNTQLDGPASIALDSAANIYVANSGSYNPLDDSVTVYPALGNTTGIVNEAPTFAIVGNADDIVFPQGLTLDPSGNLYVVNDAEAAGLLYSYAVFPPDSAHPSLVDFADDLYAPEGITLDPGGNVYVANDSASTAEAPDSITVYPPATASPNAVITSSAQMLVPAGISVDSVGDVLVANDGTESGGQDGITVYAPGSYANAPPTDVVFGTNTGLNLPLGIVLDSKQNLYVVNATGGSSFQGSITIYKETSTGNATPIGTISGANTGLNFPYAIALDSADNIYVANAVGGPDFQGSVTIYKAYSDGNIRPLATISDNPSCAPCDNTGLNTPSGIALDSSANIYVTNSGSLNGGGDSVTVYPPLGSSTGTLNETPNFNITGSDTGLDVPQGLTLDPSGNIYVLNNGSFTGGADSLTAYPPASNGNAAPTLTLSGPLTGLGLPQGITIAPVSAGSGGAVRLNGRQRAGRQAFPLAPLGSNHPRRLRGQQRTALSILSQRHKNTADWGN